MCTDIFKLMTALHKTTKRLFWGSSSYILLTWGQILLILVNDYFRGQLALSIGQESIKSYLPSKKIYWCQTTRHDFALDRKVINNHMIVFSSVQLLTKCC